MYRILVLLVVFVSAHSRTAAAAYTIPEPEITLLQPAGLRVSIPNVDKIVVFAFNGKKNAKFTGSEPGTIAGTVQLADDGKRWVFTNTMTSFQPGDMIYYWLYVQHNDLGYRTYHQVFNVAGDDRSSSSTTTTVRSVETTPTTTTSTTTPTANKPICVPSITTILGRAQCRGQLVFDDSFSRPSLMPIWKHEVRIPLDSNDAEFVSYQSDASLCSVQNGHLLIQPKLQINEPGFGRIHFNINLDLGMNCTPIADRDLECSRQAWAYQIVPPIVSCKLNTKDTFRFIYGRIEIRAKLPQGDWLFPELFLEPFANVYGDGYDSGQMRIAFIRSNDELYTKELDNIGGSTLFGGAIVEGREEHRDTFMKNKSNIEHFGHQFHVYTLVWSDTEISLKVDGQQYGKFVGDDFRINGPANASWRSGGNMAPFDQEFYLSVGVGSGGIADFPDGSRTGRVSQRTDKPWRNDDPKAELNFWNDRDNWERTWTADGTRMEIDYIRVYAI